MATANLGLAIINASDYVSPTPINNNMDKIDKLGVDYIVAQGKSGEWWYRKWKSGRAECGIDYKDFGQKSMIQWNSGNGVFYATDQMTFGAYPFAFASAPFKVISFIEDKSLKTRLGFVVNESTSSATTTSGNFRIIDTYQSTFRPCCGIYVCGRYQ